MDEFVKEYSSVAESFGLPSLDELKQDFDINVEDLPVLKAVLDAITEKLHKMIKILEEIMQPESSVSAMREIKNLKEEDNKNVYSVYATLMNLYRRALIADIQREDSASAQIIKDIWKAYPAIKEQVIVILNKMAESWITQQNNESYQEYFG